MPMSEVSQEFQGLELPEAFLKRHYAEGVRQFQPKVVSTLGHNLADECKR